MSAMIAIKGRRNVHPKRAWPSLKSASKFLPLAVTTDGAGPVVVVLARHPGDIARPSSSVSL